MSTRAEAKAITRARLLDAARESVRDEGAAALSLRSVAGRAGIVPSAVYRHFESRDDLLTQLILDAYTGLAESLEAAVGVGGDWKRAADALRSWALAHRHEYLLIYGTPVPGYQAPEETVGAAARVAQVFLRRVTASDASLGDGLASQLDGVATAFDVPPSQLAQMLSNLAQLTGFLVLELGGHFVGTADPADLLWDHVVAGQTRGGA
ncbi:MAG: TetR/AcrR family transcriptional regulator [Rhodococcus sp.]|nr:TetR/AcrR family transcriptional regulator [Rhodococcus sp. (in: high G+C Gram-positive bacteria)]